MIYIRTFIGRKLNYIDGILRRQIELDRYLKLRPDIKLTYEYYEKPNNFIDYLSKRYLLYPYYSKEREINENYVNHITAQFLGELAFFLDCKRTMITCHDIYTFIEKGNVKNPYFVQKYSLLGLKKCSFIISVSNFTKKELVDKLKIPKEKIIVIKNSINREMFQPISENDINKVEPLYSEFKKILYVGTESERKDFLTLLKAFYLISKKIKNIKLIRVGQPMHSHVIKALGLEKNIIYLHGVSNERLKELYNLCDFFVFPSLYEGWGFPGLEAASCGTPVICSDIPIFREIYRDFPLYFPPRDFKTLAKIILNDIDNESLKIELSKKGIEQSKLYSWEKNSMKYLKLSKYIIENL